MGLMLYEYDVQPASAPRTPTKASGSFLGDLGVDDDCVTTHGVTGSLADEVVRRVRAAVASVRRCLRPGAQRPRAHNLPVLDARGDHLVGRLAALDPAAHHAQH